jgi:hypothetical protein
MLEHYFWLLEFKFKLEFHCLNPFPKIKHLNPIPNPYPSPIQPTGLAAAQQQQLAPAAQRAAHLPASEPQPAAQAAAQQPPSPLGLSAQPAHQRRSRSPPPRSVPLTGGVPTSSPTPRRPPPGLRRRRPCLGGARLPVHGPHAKGPPQSFISRPPPPGPPTRDARRLLRRALAETLAPLPSGSCRRRRLVIEEQLRRRARR